MLRSAPALALTLFLAGCSNLGYYTQAVGGHLDVLRATRPIHELVRDPATDPELRKKLEEASAIRQFASRELALPDNASYRAYADVGRPYVVWNVFAAPEFSVEPEKWCMVFAGCVNYRGYYSRDDAERFASELRQQGFDTYVGGVPAYSTLGFFDDPVLNTFLHFGDVEVARLIFHELAHQLLYVRDDSAFNESFATTVENEGIRRWLARSPNQERRRAFALHQQRKAQFLAFVDAWRDKLGALYAVNRPAEEQRRAKAQATAEMKRAYAQLKASWGGYPGYDKWFEQDLNNAKIASLTLYTQLVPAFEALLAREGHDLPGFYRRVAALARLPKAERMAALNDLTPAAGRLELARLIRTRY